jgi:pantothenate kinase
MLIDNKTWWLHSDPIIINFRQGEMTKMGLTYFIFKIPYWIFMLMQGVKHPLTSFV